MLALHDFTEFRRSILASQDFARRILEADARVRDLNERRRPMSVQRRAIAERFVFDFVTRPDRPMPVFRCECRVGDDVSLLAAIRRASPRAGESRHAPEQIQEGAQCAGDLGENGEVSQIFPFCPMP